MSHQENRGGIGLAYALEYAVPLPPKPGIQSVVSCGLMQFISLLSMTSESPEEPSDLYYTDNSPSLLCIVYTFTM